MPPLLTYIVERVEGDRLYTTADSKRGWFPASEVVAVEDGIKFFSDVIGQGPKEAYPYAARAMIYAELKHDYSHAMADLDQAIELDPKNASLYQNRGHVNQLKKDYDSAIADYTKLLEFDPRSAATYQARGRCWKEKRELDKAIGDFTAALKIDPSTVALLNDRGMTYFAGRQDDKAIADYNQIIRIQPNYVYAYNNRGNSYLAKGDRRRAIADYTKAMQVDPTYKNSVSSRAIAYMLGRQENAIKDATLAIKLAGWKSDSAIYSSLTGYFASKLLKKENQAKLFLNDVSTKARTEKWPFPIVNFLQGQLDEERLLSAASSPGEQTEAHCFIALQSLVNGQEEAARNHFRWVKENGLPEYIESAIATGELEPRREKGRQAGGARPGARSRGTKPPRPTFHESDRLPPPAHPIADCDRCGVVRLSASCRVGRCARYTWPYHCAIIN